MQLSELDYELPEELIAQEPLPERDAARLLVVDRHRPGVEHEQVRALPRLMPPSLFVFNDTRVIPARLHGRKESGGKVELLLIERTSSPGRTERWLAMGKSSKGLRPGSRLELAGGLSGQVVERVEDGQVLVELASASGAVEAALARAGEVPLPPYIKRAPNESDEDRYQTVFATRPGAVAAPTAGLHFSRALLAALAEAGHRTAHVTLHVGPGTFRPVAGESLDGHAMHRERYEVSEEAASAIAQARAECRPVVAVGTTVVRTLESAAREDGTVSATSGSTSLFIRPPFRFRVVDSLLTNFHLPRSTLLALVMAFGGVEEVRAAYDEAVRARYRFFSYGDAMLLRGHRP